jgi:hypothetical protein
MASEQSNTNMTPFFAILGVLVVGLVGYMIWKLGFDSYTIKPEVMFVDAFSDSPVQIVDLKAGGMKSGNYDVWLYFRLPGRMAELKKKAEFRREDADLELARRWFFAHMKPSPKSLEDTENWKIWKRVDSATSSISQEWLMYNWKTDDHLYRKWGY